MEYKYNLAICAIMKYEEDYVREWVKYHHIIGVKHFYIYDNNDEPDSMREVLKDYIEDGIVTLTHIPGKFKMYDAFNHCIENYKDDCKYIAYIDADELIMPVEDVPVDTLIEDLIEKHNDPNIGGLVIRWVIYGTGHHKTKPDGLMMENYLYTKNTSFQYRIKTIVNPRMVRCFMSPHYPTYISDTYYSIDEKGNKVEGARYQGGIDIIRLNHYYYKSEEEFTKMRIKRGKCDRDIPDEAIEGMIRSQIERMKNSNDNYDDIMLRYIDRMK